ncbi:MAG: epoxyqueuosine reductase, partial [Myxococcota bacterium]
MDLLDQNPTARAEALKQMAVEAGFDAAGVAPPGPFPEAGLYEEWLDAGYHGDMDWLERHRRRRTDPDRVLRGVRSVVVVSLGYDTTRPRSTERSLEPGEGWISRYAWGDDYHDVMSQMLDVFCARLEAGAPGHQFKYYVDHGPVLEKVYARYAGLGWMGKHTNLIHPERGSFFFLAVILTDLDLAADSPVADHCGTCTACLDACPTDAFAAPYVLDARKCISYLT